MNQNLKIYHRNYYARGLLILTGAKGIGKSHLLRSLESELNGHFTQIIHHPIHTVPTWETFYQQLFPDTTNQPPAALSLSEDQLRQQVLQALTQQPYLLVIDQGDRFLDDPKHNDFIQAITTTSNHQSCLLWSGAGLPKVTKAHNIFIETLAGMSFNQAKIFLTDSYPHLATSLTEKEHYWQQLNQLCGGNPTLLHHSVETIQSFYSNQIEWLITHPLTLSRSLANYFDTLFNDLSEPEQVLLYWLALRPLSWLQLKNWPLVLPFDEQELMYAWDSLHRRHLIETSLNNDGLCHITPQYLGLYLINQLQEIFVRELLEEKLDLFHSYPIVMPTAPWSQQKTLLDYFLRPVADALRKKLPLGELQARFHRLLDQLNTYSEPSRSSAPGNLFNLGADLGLSMADMDWSNQTLWHADLRLSGLQGIDFKGCQFKAAAIASGLQGQLAMALHPQGESIAIGDGQGLLQIYQWKEQRFGLHWCCDLESPIQEIIITQDDQLIVTTTGQSIHRWNSLLDPESCATAHLETETLDSIAIRNDGALMATSFSNGDIQLWDLEWGGIEKEGDSLSATSPIVRDLIFSADGKYLAGYGTDNQILVWHQVSGSNTYQTSEIPMPLNPYGTFLTLQWTDTHLNVIEAIQNTDSPDYLSNVEVRTFTVDAEMLMDDSIQVDVQRLPYGPDQPYQAVFSNNGAYIALCNIDHKVQIWHAMNPMPERAIQLPNLPYALSICNAGNILLCLETAGLSLWNLSEGKCLQTWKVVSDLDQYRDCTFYTNQGLSKAELIGVQRLGAIHCQD
ncbi:AAA family ATPase [Leptothoe sp. PORK10 BA2]|uniref:AAA family ATPase n=1 Tax=Leptothoe sp. PORK10 BA2 TaxID=3110254 RepID=UPI002B21DCA8|nr:AAA family ATPase [Leptothoe sp. PORK10 BA2]MEA5467082.1 AAA family ATPase [Leptothoe sp. PORK10 BA2]